MSSPWLMIWIQKSFLYSCPSASSDIDYCVLFTCHGIQSRWPTQIISVSSWNLEQVTQPIWLLLIIMEFKAFDISRPGHHFSTAHWQSVWNRTHTHLMRNISFFIPISTYLYLSINSYPLHSHFLPFTCILPLLRECFLFYYLYVRHYLVTCLSFYEN